MRIALTLLLVIPACFGGGSGGAPETRDGITAAGFSFGECGGYCNADLAIAGASLTLTFTSNVGSPDVVNHGTLRSATVTELADLGLELASQELAETHGCPDCNDGGASYLTLTFDNADARSTWQLGDPPPILAAADSILLGDLVNALATCVATSRVVLGSCSIP